MDALPYWTKRATQRLRDAARYIAVNFYPDYAVSFSDDVIDTANALPAHPRIGTVAFPRMTRPNYRKILCKNGRWWIYYRIAKDRIEILSVKHVLQNVPTPHHL